jgi:hypothetical protein
MALSKSGSLSVTPNAQQNSIMIRFDSDGNPTVVVVMAQSVGAVSAAPLRSSTYAMSDLDATTSAAIVAAVGVLQNKAATDAGYANS